MTMYTTMPAEDVTQHHGRPDGRDRGAAADEHAGADDPADRDHRSGGARAGSWRVSRKPAGKRRWRSFVRSCCRDDGAHHTPGEARNEKSARDCSPALRFQLDAPDQNLYVAPIVNVRPISVWNSVSSRTLSMNSVLRSSVRFCAFEDQREVVVDVPRSLRIDEQVFLVALVVAAGRCRNAADVLVAVRAVVRMLNVPFS